MTLNLEYIWSGDPKYWGKHSPVLFPIVGSLKENAYTYRDKKYSLPRHGFAREKLFSVEGSSPQSVSFTLTNDEDTLSKYPFHFLFRIRYTLDANGITVAYEVKNTSPEFMYFSVGTHPAFNVPLIEGTSYEDHFLEFETEEHADRYTIKENLLAQAVPYLYHQKTLPLKPDLFYEDALVFKDLKSTSICIKNSKNPHGVSINYDGFPYMGIWAAKDAPFVCIEPWCGVADSEDHNQKLDEKEGIIKLNGDETWLRNWSVRCF
jgi:galactose mutarotase-like enzyme